MKKLSLVLIGLAVFALSFTTATLLNEEEPWKEEQLIQPAELAKKMSQRNMPMPIIICVGPVNYFDAAINVGQALEKKNIEQLKIYLEKLPKDTSVVIYCGCCPFEHCPNIR